MPQKLLTTDPELSNLLGPLSKEEYAQLEASVLADGCRDAIVTWPRDGELVIVDGHNRYKICLAYKLPYPVDERDFADLASAAKWAVEQQTGRRNVTDERRRYLIGRIYAASKGERGGDYKSEEGKEATGSTADKVAAQFGVSSATVVSAEKYADRLDELDSTVTTAILDGGIKATVKNVAALAEFDGASQRGFVSEVRKGKAKNLTAALQTDEVTPATPAAPAVEDETGGVDAEMAAWNKAVESWARKMTALLREAPEGTWLDDNQKGIIDGQLKSAAKSARVRKAEGRHPKCDGTGCKPCRWTGWMPKIELDSIAGG